MKSKLAILAKAFLWGCLVILFPVVSGVIATVTHADSVKTLWLQSGCMALSLLPPLILCLTGKWRLSEIGFGSFNANGLKRALFFLPLVAIYIPVTLSGFYIKSASYVLGCLFLYLFVGVAEEVYFRGIVPWYLGKVFSQKSLILFSTLIFGVGHIAVAFNGGDALDTVLTVLNAFIFGWLAIEVALLSGNIAVPIALHFLFDFETKIVAMSGGGLLVAELARGTIMVVLAIWLAIVLKGRGKTAALSPEQHVKRKKRRIMVVCVIGAVIVLALCSILGLSVYGKKQTAKIPELTFEDCLAYTLANNPDGVITVGVIENGEASYTVYGEGGRELPQELRAYEIGSMTKTFTAALIQKAVEEGRVRLDDTLDQHLSLPAENRYPTIAALLTHTSGYRSWYFDAPMVGNFFARRNDFCGVTGGMVMEQLRKLSVAKSAYPFEYSNYGYAVLGLVLESVYGEAYTTLVNDFAQEIGLVHTHISSGELAHCWDWREGDAYLSAGALTSDIEDMLTYAQLQLADTGLFGECHRVIAPIRATTETNALMGIRMDAIGMAWITDEANGIVWHNGGTGSYNCYLGIRPKTGKAVVILSNLSPSYRIPATVMGVKLLTE